MATQAGKDENAGAPGKPSDRRRQPRFDVDVPVRLSANGSTFAGFLCDICRDAAWVESQRICVVGSEVSIAMELPGTGGPMQIEGRVIRIGPGDKEPNGMAILFNDLSPAVATRIDFFVALQGY